MTDPQRLRDAPYLAEIVDTSDDAIIAKDLEGIIHSCNAGAERVFGYPAAELVGQSIRMLIPDDRQSEEDEILQRIAAGERIDHLETVRVRKDGRSIHVSVTISPIRNAAGEVVGAFKIARDITEQKRAQTERAYLAAIIDSSEDAILSKNLDGIIQSANGMAETIFGYSAAELVGRSVRILIPPERQREEDEILARVRRGERIAHFETVRLTKGGKPIDISLSVSPIRDRSGAIVGVAKIARDITEQKRLARELAAQQEWFRVTLGSIGDAVIATSQDGKVAFMNPVAERLTGWPLAEARSRDCGDVFRIINEASRRPVESPVDRVLAHGIVVGLANHTVLVRPDGSEVPVDDSGAPIVDRDGRIIGAVLVFRDVTERRRVDAERRTAAIERERLHASERSAREEAERATRVKDEFIAMVSHELRTPLNAILGWAHLMVQPEPSPEVVRRGVEVIVRNTRLQAQLISDLLDVSGIVSGRLRLTLEEIDPAAVIDDAIEAVQPRADDEHVVIEDDLHDVGRIVADSARLQQIVWNLLWNAIKFTPEGGRVTVRLRRRSVEEIEITVRDTGLGIPRDVLPRIFERFQQGSPTITRQFGGLGLGLSIVKYLVELHGGSVRADSPGEGGGSTFTVLMPSGSAVSEKTTTPPTDVAPEPDPVPLLAGVRIVIVEDDDDTLDFLSRYLSSCGAEVTTASSAAQALEIMPTSDADILVSDIGLPEMNGYELMRRIREMDSSPAAGIPAIALTAYARREDRTRAFHAGFQAHLGKPIEPPELAATVARLAPPAKNRAGD